MRLFVFFVLLLPPGTADTSGDMAGVQPELFYVPNGGTFRCPITGGQCAYTRTEYSSVDASDGLDFENANGAAWAAKDPTTDKLILGECSRPDDNCFVECTANCTCRQPDGNLCEEATSRAPTTAPPTPVPLPQVCEAKRNTESCSEAMNLVPAGQNFDCYNFCGGIFYTACKFGANCTKQTCDNATETGINSFIMGCTDQDRTSTGSGGSGSYFIMNNVAMVLISATLIISSLLL